MSSNTGNDNGGPSGSGGGVGGSGGTLTGMAAVEQVFHFLDGPADVLSSATACRRWRELACADSVWRAKFRRERLVEKARLFEVALPAVPSAQGGAAAAAAAGTAAVVKDEAAGVGLAFYARIFSLQVLGSVVVLRSPRVASCTHLITACRSRTLLPLCRGTR